MSASDIVYQFDHFKKTEEYRMNAIYNQFIKIML